MLILTQTAGDSGCNQESAWCTHTLANCTLITQLGSDRYCVFIYFLFSAHTAQGPRRPAGPSVCVCDCVRVHVSVCVHYYYYFSLNHMQMKLPPRLQLTGRATLSTLGPIKSKCNPLFAREIHHFYCRRCILKCCSPPTCWWSFMSYTTLLHYRVKRFLLALLIYWVCRRSPAPFMSISNARNTQCSCQADLFQYSRTAALARSLGGAKRLMYLWNVRSLATNLWEWHAMGEQEETMQVLQNQIYVCNTFCVRCIIIYLLWKV